MSVEWPARLCAADRSDYLAQHYPPRDDYPSPVVCEGLAGWIQKRTTAEDRILVWGLECQIYVLADRMFATQAPFDLMLTSAAAGRMASDWQARQRRRFIDLLKSERPRLIVVTSRDSNPVEPRASDVDIDKVPGFRDCLYAQYELVHQRERFDIYELRSRAASIPSRQAGGG